MRFPYGECSNKSQTYSDLVECHNRKIQSFQKEYDETNGDINRCRYEFITDENADTCDHWSGRLEQDIHRQLTMVGPHTVKKGTAKKLTILLENTSGLGVLNQHYFPAYKGDD